MRNPEAEFEAVVKDLQLAHSIYPKINADLLLAEAYCAKRDYAFAIKWMRIYGARVDRANDILYQRLNADICDNTGRVQEAIASYVKLSEIDGINAPYYTQRLHVLLDTENDELVHLLDSSASEESADEL